MSFRPPRPEPVAPTAPPSPEPLILRPLPPRSEGGWWRLRCALIRADAVDPAQAEQEAWIELPAADQPPDWDPADLEPFAIALVMAAMREGRDLLIDGAVSPRLLAGLEEWVGHWARLRPDRYHRIALRLSTPDRPPPRCPPASPQVAVLAFSGGVDARYSLWRHHRGVVQHRRRQLVAAVIVQGLDLPLNHSEAFATAQAEARLSLEPLGLPLLPVRTNLRPLTGAGIDEAHGAVLVACLQLLKARAGTALLGSSEPYDDLVPGWGSSPLTDPLLSSDSLQVVHDGAEDDRCDKIRLLARWPDSTANLRVCFRYELARGRNCLRCEKCLRTIAGFAVQGLPVPASLGGDAAVLDRRVPWFKLRTPAQVVEWRILQRRAAGQPGLRWARWLPWLFLHHALWWRWHRLRALWRPQA